MTKYLAILTDLGGVLLPINFQVMCRKFALSSSLSAGKIKRLFLSPTPTHRNFGLGLVSSKRFYGYMKHVLSLKNVGYEEFVSVYTGVFKRNEKVIGIFRDLSKRYPLALISNNNVLRYGAQSKLLGKDMHLFKEVILSFELHTMKPKNKIFLETTKRLGINPGACVYIDDKKSNMTGAGKLGMKCIHFKSAAQLMADLKKIGVAV